MARVNFAPVMLLVGLVAVIMVVQLLGRNPNGIKGIITQIDNFISQMFSVQPVAPTPPTTTAPLPPAPPTTPITPSAPTTTPGICPEGQTGDPDTSGCFPGTCAERDGEACTCRTCCNGNGCAGSINGDEPMLSNRQCVCKCNEPCGGGDDDEDDDDEDDDDDGNGGGGGGSGRDTPSRAAQTIQNRCGKLTGQTRLACDRSFVAGNLARRHRRQALRANRIFRVANTR